MSQRLFPTITPQTYHLTLQPNLSDFTFQGHETITFSLQQASRKILFHSVDLRVTHAQLIQDGEKLTPEITYEGQYVTFSFSQEISAGTKQVYLEFTGKLQDKLKGFYKSQYEVDGEKKYLAVTQFEEIGARYTFPCIDEPSAKAIFTITLIVNEHLTAISNTSVEKETVENGLKTLQFTPTPKMSTYILAFLVGEFEYESTTSKEGVEIRAYTTPGKKHLTNFALDVAAKSLSFYNSYFATDYPLPKLDLIALPDFDAGAMENWGAVTFRESILLIDSEKSSSANKQWSALVIAHELAHMWFGNLVTMKWWTDLWLNEGFACYIEYLAVNALFPEWDMWKQFAVAEHNPALKLDSLKNTHAIEVPIDDESQVKEIFDEISYAKGANVIQMLASYLGEDVFRDGLRLYLKNHSYANTITQDLWESLEEVSHKPVTSIMSAWTKEPGYPLLTVSQKEGSLEISQQRFFANPLVAQTVTTLWKVPMRVLQEGSEEAVLLEGKSQSVVAHNGWVKINAQETSFVRTLYDTQLTQELKKPISDKVLSAVDRMGIIRDAFDTAEAGFSSVTHALQLLQSYTNEDDYIAWVSIASHLSSVENIIAHIPEIQDAFDEFSQQTFAIIAGKMGWEKKEGESQTDVLLRSLVLGAFGKYGDRATIEKAKELFLAYVQLGKVIESDIRGVVYALVARYGEEKEWEQLVTIYRHEELQQEKNRILGALTLFQEKSLIQKTLEWLMTDEVRTQDKSRVFGLIFGNEKAQSLAWEFIMSHWVDFEKMYSGTHGFTRLIEGVGEMVGEEALKSVQDFLVSHTTEDIARTSQQVIEKIQANTSWLQRDREKLVQFFNK